jgi:hypothetical protein
MRYGCGHRTRTPRPRRATKQGTSPHTRARRSRSQKVGERSAVAGNAGVSPARGSERTFHEKNLPIKRIFEHYPSKSRTTWVAEGYPLYCDGEDGAFDAAG